MAIIQYFAADRDRRDLIDFIKSLNVKIHPADLRSGRNLDCSPDAQTNMWHIAFIPIDKILEHPAKPGFARGGNPLIDWDEPFTKNHNLIAGSFEWTDFDSHLCTLFGINRQEVIEVGKIFSKIQRWIRKNYTNLDGDSFWFAPEAARHRTVEGYGAGSNFADDVTFEQLVIGDEGEIIETRRLNDLSEFEDR